MSGELSSFVWAIQQAHKNARTRKDIQEAEAYTLFCLESNPFQIFAVPGTDAPVGYWKIETMYRKGFCWLDQSEIVTGRKRTVAKRKEKEK